MDKKTVIDYTKGTITGGYNSHSDERLNNITINIYNGNDENNAKLDDVVVIDKDWVNTRFMVSDIELDKELAELRYYSSAVNKFTDSSAGGNIGINAKPQFTAYCDIPIPGRNSDNAKVNIGGGGNSFGMGRYYSEAIDDNEQTVFLEFGLPKFNSLFDFFTKAVSYEDSVLANTGRAPYGYIAGQFGGNIVMLAAFPLVTISIWVIKFAVGLIAGHGAFNYYYLDPMMHSYWGTVNTIVTQLATEMGILIPELQDTQNKGQMGVNVRMNQADLDGMRALAPSMLSDNNYIDVFRVATRAQAMANKQALRDRELYTSDPNNEFNFLKYVTGKYETTNKNVNGSSVSDAFNTATMFSKYLDKTVKKSDTYYGQPDLTNKPRSTTVKDGESIANQDKKNIDTARTPTGGYPYDSAIESGLTKFIHAIDSTVRDGAMHAIFRVDYTGSVSESFSNSVGEIESGGVLKSLSKKSRDVKFSFSGGNILGDVITDAVGYAKDFAMGALDSVTYGASNVLQTLIGGGYIDLPKKWDDSSISLPQVTYNMKLISPYGNQISQLQNIYIPLAMLLAGTLPLSTGKASYTSPFICSLFCKGVQNVKLGMITSLTITRGTSNLGFNKDRRALAIDVSFTVTDFSNIIAAPVNKSIFDNIFSVPLDDDSPLGNYISTLGSRDILTNKYTWPKIKLRASRTVMAAERAISPTAWGMRVGASLNGVLGGFVSQKSLTLK